VLAARLFQTYLLSHPYERKHFLAVRRKAPPSPLQSEYWSATPYSLGPHAVRWAVRPLPIDPPLGKPDAHAMADPALHAKQNELRAHLVAHLSQRRALFDFYVQVQTDANAMPVEDPTIAWDERVSPPRKIGQLEINAQIFDTEHKRALGEGLSFTPWHSLPEHRPLGGINRARRAVYLALAAQRRELNGVARVEPDDEWLSREWDQSIRTAVPSPLFNATVV
jgi:hypothetical protein